MSSPPFAALAFSKASRLICTMDFFLPPAAASGRGVASEPSGLMSALPAMTGSLRGEPTWKVWAGLAVFGDADGAEACWDEGAGLGAGAGAAGAGAADEARAGGEKAGAGAGSGMGAGPVQARGEAGEATLAAVGGAGDVAGATAS